MSEIRTLRDDFAVQAAQAALTDALRGYGFICPTVTAEAARLAYEVADAMLKEGAAVRLKGAVHIRLNGQPVRGR